MKILHQVWKQLIWVWNEFQGYEKSAWRCEKYDKCYETNTPLNPGTKIVSMVRNRSIRRVQIEAHSTFFTTKNESKFVLLTTIFTTNGLVSYYWNYFCTRLDLFRTIETIFVRNRSIRVFLCFRGVQLETHSTFFTTKNESKFVLCATVAHHEWICFVLLKLFLYQAGTKKVSIVETLIFKLPQEVSSSASTDSEFWPGLRSRYPGCSLSSKGLSAAPVQLGPQM